MDNKINNRLANGIHNYDKVLELIIKNDGISRTEISNVTGLSASSVTNITNKLMSNHLIKESELIQSENSGRKAVLLRLNPLGGFFISLVFVNKSVRLDFYNLERKVGNSYYIPLGGSVVTGEFIIEKIEEEVQYNYKYGKFFGIILCFPSAVLEGREGVDELGYKFEQDCFDKLKNFYPNTKVIIESFCATNAYRLVAINKYSKVMSLETGRVLASAINLNGKFLDKKHFTLKLEDFYSHSEGGQNKLADCFTEKGICKAYSSLYNNAKTFEQIVSDYKNNDQLAVKLIEDSIITSTNAIKEFVQFVGVECLVLSGSFLLMGEGFKNLLEKAFADLVDVKIEYSTSVDDISRGGVSYSFDCLFSK